MLRYSADQVLKIVANEKILKSPFHDVLEMMGNDYWVMILFTMFMAWATIYGPELLLILYTGIISLIDRMAHFLGWQRPQTMRTRAIARPGDDNRRQELNCSEQVCFNGISSVLENRRIYSIKQSEKPLFEQTTFLKENTLTEHQCAAYNFREEKRAKYLSDLFITTDWDNRSVLISPTFLTSRKDIDDKKMGDAVNEVFKTIFPEVYSSSSYCRNPAAFDKRFTEGSLGWMHQQLRTDKNSFNKFRSVIANHQVRLMFSKVNCEEELYADAENATLVGELYNVLDDHMDQTSNGKKMGKGTKVSDETLTKLQEKRKNVLGTMNRHSKLSTRKECLQKGQGIGNVFTIDGTTDCMPID